VLDRIVRLSYLTFTMQTIWRRLLSIAALAVLLGAGNVLAAEAIPGFNPKDLPPDHKWIAVNGIPMVYTEQGKGDPLLVFTPYPFSTRLWSGFSKYLAAFAHVIIVEPPGLRAPASMGGDFSTSHLLPTYRDFVRALNLNKINVLGVGESGAVAVAFGHHFPELTHTVVSIEGFESVNWSKEFAQTYTYFQRAADGSLGMLLAAGTVKYQKQAPSKQEMDALLFPLKTEDQKKAVQARFEAYKDDLRFGYVLGMVPFVDRPLLIIRAANDQIYPDTYHQRTRDHVRKVRVRYKVVSDSGFFAFLDQPKKVADLVKAFFVEQQQ
jgi:pimeloyl-ACP methyl ester carboxylesterase